ncbi:CBS domain-containing protein [Candidatus Woesearchaeota archaeon]|nr:CBS domain-containing protein [Candidatus Woesearchaeota archaeon]
MKTGYKVYDCMTTKPISVPSDVSLEECAKVMAKNHVGALVIKDNHQSKGLITEQDIVRKVIAKGINPLTKKVSDFMETEIMTISPNDDIYDALIKMRDSNIRHLPAVENGKMVGLLTLKDILKIEPQLFELLVEKFELREETRKPISRIIEREAICQGCGAYAEDIRKVKGSLLCERCASEQA